MTVDVRVVFFEAHWFQVDRCFGRGPADVLRGTREGKYFFIKTLIAVFGLAGAENGGFRQGGTDGGHFNST